MKLEMNFESDLASYGRKKSRKKKLCVVWCDCVRKWSWTSHQKTAENENIFWLHEENFENKTTIDKLMA